MALLYRAIEPRREHQAVQPVVENIQVTSFFTCHPRTVFKEYIYKHKYALHAWRATNAKCGLQCVKMSSIKAHQGSACYTVAATYHRFAAFTLFYQRLVDSLFSYNPKMDECEITFTGYERENLDILLSEIRSECLYNGVNKWNFSVYVISRTITIEDFFDGKAHGVTVKVSKPSAYANVCLVVLLYKAVDSKVCDQRKIPYCSAISQSPRTFDTVSFVRKGRPCKTALRRRPGRRVSCASYKYVRNKLSSPAGNGQSLRTFVPGKTVSENIASHQ